MVNLRKLIKMRAAVLEKIIPDFGSSFRVLAFENSGPHCLNYWHYHPEYELVYINKGGATRHIGNSISRYEDGDLILVGSNLPHRSFTEDLMEPHTETLIQWHPDFLGKDFFKKPEFTPILQLLKRSQNGLTFSGQTKKEVGQLMLGINKIRPFERMHIFLQILQKLALSEEYENLKASGFELIYRPNDQQRIKTIFNYVQNHFDQAIDLQTIADTINMTRQSFCRYFKQCTGQTFSEFVNQFRISQATQMLASTPGSIGEISYRCGFNNLSTFNKQFKKTTGMTPLAYRKNYQRTLEV